LLLVQLTIDQRLQENQDQQERFAQENAKRERQASERANLRLTLSLQEDLTDLDLRGADLQGVSLSNKRVLRADFSGANLSGAYLSGADLRNANFEGAKLPRAYLGDADLRGANLRSANFFQADLSDVRLQANADFPNIINYANFAGACFIGANLAFVVFADVDVRGADFRFTNLTGGYFADVKYDDKTRWPKGYDVQSHAAAQDVTPNHKLPTLKLPPRRVPCEPPPPYEVVGP
jgi:uncharacterized protein YjbI with pentapeptide repeats